MKIFDKYFLPYAEYCLRTTLSEDELKETLAKECPATSDVLSWKAIKAAMGLSKTIVFSCDPDDPLHLHPIKAYRNTSRGALFIRCEKAAGEETILHISIAQSGKYKWLLYAMRHYCCSNGLLLWNEAVVESCTVPFGIMITAMYVNINERRCLNEKKQKTYNYCCSSNNSLQRDSECTRC